MPIYEYSCQKCGAVQEIIQKMSDPAPVCAKCGAPDTRRLVSHSSFVLKGSGWYQTDYGGKSGGSSDAGKES
jgi:putative FmdB family regulatory protein